MLRWHKVAVLARKEVCDILRDRRTVFMAVIFPLILYPLLIIGLIQASVVEGTKARREKPLVAISGAEFAPALAKRIADGEGLTTAQFDGSSLELQKAGAAAGVVIPKDFPETLSANRTAKVTVIYDSADQKSIDARGKIADIINSYSGEVLAGRLAAVSLDKAFVRPLEINESDIATPRQRGAFRLGKMVAFLLVIFCMMGALYPALDTVSGEKERGTLETLLSIPASRMEIMSGKYVAVFAMSLASVAANFISLSITMLLVTELMKGAASTAGMSIDFSIPPAAVMLLVPALVPLAAFFSAVSLGIAAFARSTREGQYYLGPLYAAALPLTAAAIVPGMQLTYLTALVPIMSISLFLKDGFLGTLPVMPAILAVVAQCAYAFVALKWAVAVFSREEVLFASPSAEGEEPLATKGYARPTQIFVTWAVSAILFFYVGGLLQQRTGALSVVTGVMAYGGFVLGPLVVLFFVSGLDARKILPFGGLDGRAIAAGALFIPAAILVNVAASAVQHAILAPPEAAANMIRLHQSASYAALFVSVVLLPAVCEEVFYRGMVFNSLAARMSAGWAVILSSAIFAMAHFSPYEAAPLFALGVVLALAMRSSGTLLLPIAIHFANNGVTITVARMGYNPEIGWLGAAVAGVVGAALAAAGVRILRRPAAS